MMKCPSRAWGLAIGLFIFGFCLWFFWGSDEAILNGRLDDIQQALSADEHKGNLGALADAGSLKSFFAPEGVQILLNERRSLRKTPEQIVQMAVMWMQHSGGCAVDISKRTHAFPEADKAFSKVWVIAQAAGYVTELENGGWVAIGWEKRDGEWLIVSVRFMEQ